MFLLWLGASISISEIYTGGLLAPLGLGLGITAIIIGHVVGTALLALGGYVSFFRKSNALESLNHSLGRGGGRLAALCNVVQLAGWTIVMVVQAGSAVTSIFPNLGFTPVSLALGLIVLVWALSFGSPAQWVNSAVVVLLAALCVVLFGESAGRAASPAPFSESMSFALAVELSIAMPISWLPLAGDYSSKTDDRICAAAMPFAGYFLGSILMYGFGLFIRVHTGGDFFSLISASGFRFAACAVVVLSTMTTAFLDLYSAAVSSTQFVKTKSPRLPILVIGIAAAAVSAVFPAEAYSDFLMNFLTAIGMVFAPIYAWVFTGFLMKEVEFGGKEPGKTGAAGRFITSFNLPGLIVIAAGMVLYRVCTNAGIGIPTLISMAAVAVLYIVIRKLRSKQ
jgi:putative hydroxymethylpyrimidine transporter CytX